MTVEQSHFEQFTPTHNFGLTFAKHEFKHLETSKTGFINPEKKIQKYKSAKIIAGMVFYKIL